MSQKELPAGRPEPETHRKRFSFKDLAYTPLWNVVLIVAGSALYAFGAKSVVLAHGFITGGIFGASLLLYYLTDFLSAGTWSLLLNLPLFAAAWVFLSRRFLLYSLLSMFSQRKLTYIISKDNPQIAQALLERGWQATIIKAKGAYSGKDQDILMTITNNIYLKQLEEMVFTVDQNAIFVVENTFNVLGSVFGRRKQY